MEVKHRDKYRLCAEKYKNGFPWTVIRTKTVLLAK